MRSVTEAAITVEGVRKKYGGKGGAYALDGLDLRVARGTVHGVLGQNGAGKTTLVRILSTLLRPDAGRIEVVGGGRGVRGDYVDYLVPGMLALTMAFGLEGTTVALTQDLNKGVIDRFRSMPMADGAVLVGRSAADMLQSALVLAVLLGVGFALGWRAHGGPGGLLGALGLLLLFRFAMLWIGIHLALVAGRPELVQAVQILVWPVGFLSNAFAVPGSMPGWLGTIVQWNPMSHTATAVRDLLGGPGGESGHVTAAVLWPLALLAVFFPLALRRFRRLSR